MILAKATTRKLEALQCAGSDLSRLMHKLQEEVRLLKGPDLAGNRGEQRCSSSTKVPLLQRRPLGSKPDELDVKHCFRRYSSNRRLLPCDLGHSHFTSLWPSVHRCPER